MLKRLLLPFLFAASIVPDAAAEPPGVIVSIKPLHSLAAAVMDGVAAPGLLVDGAASPHSYALRPSDAARLAHAQLVFWVGPSFESFLAKPLASLAGEATVLAMEELPGLVLFPPREGGVWDAHAAEPGHSPDHEEEDAEEDAEEHAEEAHGDGHHPGALDAHLWLDPGNAKVIAAAMAEALVEADPANEAAYRANAEALGRRIDALDAEIAVQLMAVKDRPFIVLHDAYQYFEARYELAAAGSIQVSPDQPPGARRLLEIRAEIAERGVACVFREPQVEPALVELVLEGSKARQGELDPEAVSLPEGPELYFDLMRGLARGISGCLGEGG
jgi:zinc transport system substrate-binding protein